MKRIQLLRCSEYTRTNCLISSIITHQGKKLEQIILQNIATPLEAKPTIRGALLMSWEQERGMTESVILYMRGVKRMQREVKIVPDTVNEQHYHGSVQFHSVQLQCPCCVEETQLCLALLQPPGSAHTHTNTQSHATTGTKCTTKAVVLQQQLNTVKWITCAVGADPPLYLESLHLVLE